MKFHQLHNGAKRVVLKVRNAGYKAAAVVTTSLMAAPAFAQTSNTPATLEDAAAFMETKGAIALAVAAAITLIILGLKGAKLPRRG